MKIFFRTTLIIATALYVTSPLADKLSDQLAFLMDLQERYFNNSVGFCQDVNPGISAVYKGYLENYEKGARSGLQEVSKKLDPREMSMNEQDKKQMLAIQDKQAAFLLEQVQAKPEQGCSYLAKIFSESGQDAAKNQILSSYNNYMKEKAK
jgi:hypothetical protein